MIGLGLAIPQASVRARFGGGVAAPAVYLDTGSFAAAASRTDAVDNGLYDVLVRNGGTVEWRRLAVVSGSASVTGPSGGNVTRAQYYGPLTLIPKATGSYGPPLLAGSIFNSAGHSQWPAASPAMLRSMATFSAERGSSTDAQSHQGVCYVSATEYVTAGTTAMYGWVRDAAHGASDWTLNGKSNTAPFTGVPNVNHLGAPMYYPTKGWLIYLAVNWAGSAATTTYATILIFNASDHSFVKYLPMGQNTGLSLDGAWVDDANKIMGCTNYNDAGTMRRYDLAVIDALANGADPAPARLSDLSDSRITAFYNLAQGSTYKAGLIHTRAARVTGSNTTLCIVERSATTGKWIKEHDGTLNTGGLSTEGIDWDGSQLMVLVGRASDNIVQYFDLQADPVAAKGGLTLAGNHGVIGGVAAPTGDYTVQVTAKLSSLANINGGKPSLWDATSDAGKHEGQGESTGALTGRGSATATVSPTGEMVVNTLQTGGLSYTSATGATVVLTHSNGRTTGGVSGTGGVATAGAGTPVAMVANAYFGVAAHQANGKSVGLIAHQVVFNAALTGAQMEAYRLDPTLAWDAADGLSAAQKSAAEGS